MVILASRRSLSAGVKSTPVRTRLSIAQNLLTFGAQKWPRNGRTNSAYTHHVNGAKSVAKMQPVAILFETL